MCAHYLTPLRSNKICGISIVRVFFDKNKINTRKEVIVVKECQSNFPEKRKRMPLMIHFSNPLPSMPISGVTAHDSGGTTGAGGPTGEDANMDFDD